MTDAWIGVDLDGTLAKYDGYVSEEHIGEPIWPMVDRVREWLLEGKTVKIFTARVAHSPRSIPFINVWTEKYFGQSLPVTCVKDMYMVELWDDRAVQVITNTGLTFEEYTRAESAPAADAVSNYPTGASQADGHAGEEDALPWTDGVEEPW